MHFELFSGPILDVNFTSKIGQFTSKLVQNGSKIIALLKVTKIKMQVSYLQCTRIQMKVIMHSMFTQHFELHINSVYVCAHSLNAFST